MGKAYHPGVDASIKQPRWLLTNAFISKNILNTLPINPLPSIPKAFGTLPWRERARVRGYGFIYKFL
jgi:hypothetical protein